MELSDESETGLEVIERNIDHDKINFPLDGLTFIGHISISAMQQPTPKRIAELRRLDKLRRLHAAEQRHAAELAERRAKLLADGTLTFCGVLQIQTGLRHKWSAQWFQLQADGTEIAQYDKEGGKQKRAISLGHCRRVAVNVEDPTVVEISVLVPSQKEGKEGKEELVAVKAETAEMAADWQKKLLEVRALIGEPLGTELAGVSGGDDALDNPMMRHTVA